jgi:hypothetical protein
MAGLFSGLGNGGDDRRAVMRTRLRRVANLSAAFVACDAGHKLDFTLLNYPNGIKIIQPGVDAPAATLGWRRIKKTTLKGLHQSHTYRSSNSTS